MVDFNLIFIVLIIVEIITIFGRFVLKIRSMDIFIKIMKRFGLKRMFHLHHGYIGIILIISSIFYPIIYNYSTLSIGLAIFLSDLTHHFIVLNFIVGNPEFYIFYRNTDFYKIEKKFKKKTNKFLNKLINYS